VDILQGKRGHIAR